MGGNAKTTEFLKECMADALIKLLKTKPIEKISVPEIVELAGVGRATFFRNFTTKNEAVTFKIVRLWERYAEEHDLAERRKYTLDNALDFFQFNYSIQNLLTLLYERNLQFALYDAFYSVMMSQCGADAVECYDSRFHSYGLFGLLDEWIIRGFYESPERMAEISKEISK
ncbi:MAG: TetR family transcriptional regulator C-terminal domain-containing protein [Lachnospiraceae bacterium]|nr:TetR family transcriptional regulator C-terminal domain-containing protein [Lachnospiraceae bacterium]